MNWNVIAKYASGGAILASVFALVWVGKVDAQVYVGLAGSALAGLGLGAGINLVRPQQPAPPSAPQP